MSQIDLSKIAVKEAPRPKAKRFYKTVSVAEEGGVCRILLDGRPVRTPAANALETPSRALAEAVAREWDAQEREIDPTTMPIMRLVATALDRVAPQRTAVIKALLDYVDADLICYRAGHPADLKARQEVHWQPIVDWLAANHGIALAVRDGLMPQSQAATAIAKFEAAISALDDGRLTAFQACAGVTNSLALAMALVHGRLNARDVSAAAHLDEIYQMEKWGEDKLAIERRRAIESEIEAVEAYLRLLSA